jgi:flavin reductase (DIM6/NTAB) family NADH-FMN oxidoreductase RutF
MNDGQSGPPEEEGNAMTITDVLVPTTDPNELRRAFSCFPSGIAAVCALVDGVPTGMAVASFTSVSLDPPLASICIDHSSSTWPKLRKSSRIGVSILSEGHERACRQLSSKQGDRFAQLDVAATAEGALMLIGATAWLDCSIDTEVQAGDHSIIVLRVESLDAHPAAAPLVFHGSRFHRLPGVAID